MQFLHGYDSDGVFQRLHFTSAEQRGLVIAEKLGEGRRDNHRFFSQLFSAIMIKQKEC